MQYSVNSIIGYTISAKDGELGKVSEFYFDDHTWTIRYLVVDTGTWLSERKVLIPHSALEQTDWESKTFKVRLTMEQVRNSPATETEKTVSRDNELELFNHYGLPIYWGDIYNLGNVRTFPFMINNSTTENNSELSKTPEGDPHLRSTKIVEGYNIQSNDGEIGHVEDFIIDDKNWNLVFIIVDTHNWLPGRKVLVSPHWIKQIDWNEEKVFVNLSQESIKNSPEFDPDEQITDDYEKVLFEYYGEAIKPKKLDAVK